MSLQELLALCPESWAVWITFAVTICAAVAVILPVPSENTSAWYKAPYTAIQWVAFNWGKAKNASNTPVAGTGTDGGHS